MKEEIQRYLPVAHPWRENILWLDELDSTNTRLKQLAEQGAPHGTVLMADRQTGGRGRWGRSFHSPAGCGIYMSILLRPECEASELMHLTCATAVAACDAIESVTGLRPGIKWTNDLVFGQRKLAGILTELGLDRQGHLRYAVIGIGINCCQKNSDFPEDIREMAGSLASVTGKEIQRARVAGALICAMEKIQGQLLTDREGLLAQYRRDCMTLGKQIRLVRGDTESFGTALDIDDAGGLVVQFADGRIQTVTSGEVSVRGMYGYL